jgi:RHS repeat-associated protein
MIKTGTTENLHYVCTDYLGNINMLIDETRTITQHNSFDAWGRRRNPADWSYTNITTTTAILNRGFTGHEHLDDFGLINMNARLYDPFIGRMLGPDNYLQDASNSQNYNRYSYVLNNPTRYTDPTGNAYDGGTWSQGAAATFAANYNNHTAEYAAWEQFFNAEKADMMRELMPQSGGGSSIAEVNMGEGYTPIGDNSSSAFVQNYYAFRAGLKHFRELYERYGNMLPTPGSGGLTTSFEGFKNFMLDQAKYNQIEVAAVVFNYQNSTDIFYYIMPWSNNSASKATFNIENLPNKSNVSIHSMYHTHPEIGLSWGQYVKPGPSREDALVSQYRQILSYIVSPQCDIWIVDLYERSVIIPKQCTYGRKITKW